LHVAPEVAAAHLRIGPEPVYPLAVLLPEAVGSGDACLVPGRIFLRVHIGASRPRRLRSIDIPLGHLNFLPSCVSPVQVAGVLPGPAGNRTCGYPNEPAPDRKNCRHGRGRSPKMAEPMRTLVAPKAMAVSKSPDMPIESRGRPHSPAS